MFQKASKKLMYTRENVCMSIWKEKSVYAVGSQSYVTLVDPRSQKQSMSHIPSKQRGCGKSNSVDHKPHAYLFNNIKV